MGRLPTASRNATITSNAAYALESSSSSPLLNLPPTSCELRHAANLSTSARTLEALVSVDSTAAGPDM